MAVAPYVHIRVESLNARRFFFNFLIESRETPHGRRPTGAPPFDSVARASPSYLHPLAYVPVPVDKASTSTRHDLRNRCTFHSATWTASGNASTPREQSRVVTAATLARTVSRRPEEFLLFPLVSVDFSVLLNFPTFWPPRNSTRQFDSK